MLLRKLLINPGVPVVSACFITYKLNERRLE